MKTNTASAPAKKLMNPAIAPKGENVKVTKKPAKAEKPAKKIVAALSEYNGNPMIVLAAEGEDYGFQFGLGKAQKLVAPGMYEAVKAFVASGGKSID